jgi:hypothetical protein
METRTGGITAYDPSASPEAWRLSGSEAMATQVLEKARFAEENGTRREVECVVRESFWKLQKNEVKRLKSLSRVQNCTLASRP